MALSGAWTQRKPRYVNKGIIQQRLNALYSSYRPRFMTHKEIANFKKAVIDLELWWKESGGKVKDFQAMQKKALGANAARKQKVNKRAAKNRKLYRAKYGRR